MTYREAVRTTPPWILTQGKTICRRLRPLAILAMVSLISAGCLSAPPAAGGASSNAGNDTAATQPSSLGTGSLNSTGANREQAVKFAACMRANGVKQFPDPNASGQLTIDGIANGSSLDTNSTTFKQAMSACKDLEPAGFTGKKRSVQQQEAALKFAQCIRDNGVKDFPDPDPNAPLVDTDRVPSANRPGGMSALNTAMKKCGGMAASAGVTGGR
jgi:hypothetical protein